MAARLRLEFCDSFRAFCRHRHTYRDQDSLFDLRSDVCAPAFPAAYGARYFIFHRMAGGISISRPAAEFPDANVQESMGGAGHSVNNIWPFAHRARAVSELEVRATRDGGRIILRARVDEDALVAAGHADPCACGYFVAFIVSVAIARARRQKKDSAT